MKRSSPVACCVAVFFIAVLSSRDLFGWFENGHHLIASIAVDLLTPEQASALREALKAHPRFAEDFNPPVELKDAEEINRWLIGRASYWPDVARGSSYDRPTWHYQLGATLKLGDPQDVPLSPGPAPSDATLETQGLYLSQAIELCRTVWRDKSRPAGDRALAICWLGHLVADSHQPCHSGSLYSPFLFPKGDRGGNLITTKQGNNLHLFWDGQFGSLFDANDLKQRQQVIITDRDLIAEAKSAAVRERGLDPQVWIRESSEFGRSHVYAREILVPISIAEDAKSQKPELLELSEEYLSLAKQVARKRVAYSAYRLAKIWAEGL